MRYIVFLSALLGAFLLYLLSHASANTAAAGNYYSILLTLNIILATALVVLIGVQLWRFYKQIRDRSLGSRLSFRLLSSFALMAIIPGLIVYTVSVNFLTRSIESWFNVKVEAALEGGLRLGQSALDTMLADIEQKSDNMALSLAFQPKSTQLNLLNDLREKSGVQDAVLLTLQGKILAFSSSDATTFLPDMPTLDQLRQARLHVRGSIEPIPNKGLYLRVLTPINMTDLAGETRILQLLQPVPNALATTAESVQSVYQDYQELSLSRESLKEVFALTLTLVMILALLTAISFAFILSSRISAPLGVLAEGTRAIARGEYDTVLPVHGKDELGVLVQSFNSMTRQLGDATEAATRNRERVEAARGYLETILANLSSGVLTLDDKAELRTNNFAASHILDVTLGHFVDFPFTRLSEEFPLLKEFVSTILTHFNALESGEWQEQLDIIVAQGRRTLLLRGTRLPYSADSGYLVVFDDITAMVQAQRDAAWGEVARRLAHEIKNPLTPIQLSAERLEHKLVAKLSGDDAEMLRRATATIVNQVDAMKTMVNEFSEYARAPAVNFSDVDLNHLILEVLDLYAPEAISIDLTLAPQLSLIVGDANMLRQVLHNLLQNAQDALEGQPNAKIAVSTIQQASNIYLTVQDNGTGFPLELLTRVFEPYMTTKKHGTGLGLAIVKKIIEEHHGSISVENLTQGGAMVSLVFPIKDNVVKSKKSKK
ncbi:MAG TPA: ATP-binding protein [Methylophilaceae bacterium]|jgi:nitrogen fixation/metabolism regulation signal transduction histidine kinase